MDELMAYPLVLSRREIKTYHATADVIKTPLTLDVVVTRKDQAITRRVS